MLGPKRTLFMDEISTGLDASTTLQIVRCMRNLVVLRQVESHPRLCALLPCCRSVMCGHVHVRAMLEAASLPVAKLGHDHRCRSGM